jgi:phosphoribosylformylglycinamidine cyclo-ligase
VSDDGATYAAAGVDIVAGDRAVDLMRSSVARAGRPEVLGGLGGFSGLFALDTSRYRRPVLAASTDGVGTKIAVARALGKHETVGIDLVAMVVDDLVVVGAEPLFLTDYIACGKVVPERIAEIVSGIAEGCVQAGCALIGGETAEHPGLMAADEYDLAASGVGVVEQDELLGPERVRAGDALIALASSGLHSNGFSLVRHVLLERVGADLAAPLAQVDAERTLGEVLLTPTRIYAKDCLDLIGHVEVHALVHVTGGGLAGNVVRALPAGLDAVIDRSTWTPGAIFTAVGELGAVPQLDLEATLNMGIGMVAIVNAADAQRAVERLLERGVAAWQCGVVTDGHGQARLTGRYAD